MIAHFDDFCLWVYVLVDDMCKELEEQLRRPGPEPECSDSELIAICLIGECLGWDVETELLTHVTQSGDRGELDSTDTRPQKPVSGQKGTSES